MQTADYLDALKAHFKVTSDYALAQALKEHGFPSMSSSLMASYRHGKSHFDTYTCMRVAEILGIEWMQVLADVEVQRDKRLHVREFWKKVRSTAAGIMLTILGVVVSGAPSEAQARVRQDGQQQCVLC